MRRWGLGVLALGALLVLGLVFTPALIDPVAFQPHHKPTLVRALAPNRELASARRLAEGRLNGPEDVAIDGDGRLEARQRVLSHGAKPGGTSGEDRRDLLRFAAARLVDNAAVEGEPQSVEAGADQLGRNGGRPGG